MTLARRPSTRKIYQCKWTIYRQWCISHGHSISNPTLPKVADFLLYLFDSRGLSVSAIEGYRSMLSLVFRSRLPEISSSSVLRDLLRSFSISRPPSSQPSLSWDLNKVLQALRSPPFEPLEKAPIRELTQMCLFLVALATAKRVSVIQALSATVLRQGKDLILSYMPHFIAKTVGS